jgi:hypothetical protein
MLGGLSHFRNGGVYQVFWKQLSLYKFCVRFGSVGPCAMFLPVQG